MAVRAGGLSAGVFANLVLGESGSACITRTPSQQRPDSNFTRSRAARTYEAVSGVLDIARRGNRAQRAGRFSARRFNRSKFHAQRLRRCRGPAPALTAGRDGPGAQRRTGGVPAEAAGAQAPRGQAQVAFGAAATAAPHSPAQTARRCSPWRSTGTRRRTTSRRCRASARCALN